MTETDKLLVRIGTARDAISRKTEQTSLDYMIDGVLMNCSVLLKEQEAKNSQLNRFVNGFSRDAVPVVRCRDCKHRPTQTEPPKTYGFSIEFPEGSKCPCQCDDGFYSWYPNDDWFCADGERR